MSIKVRLADLNLSLIMLCSAYFVGVIRPIRARNGTVWGVEICFADSWSDDEEPSKAQAESKPSASTPTSTSKTETNNNPNNLSQTTLAALQAQLAQAEAKNKTLQAVLDRVVLGSAGAGVVGDSESGSESGSEVVGKGKGKAVVEQEKKAKGKGKGKGKGKMDIDTHYFDSYASNGKSPIHPVDIPK